MKITDILSEGPNDPNIFKAIFLAGGPGSGKSYVSGKLLKGTGMRVLNSDDIYEYLMTKAGMALDPKTIFSPAGQETRKKAKEITKRKQESHIDSRLGMIIDGTGKNVEKYAEMKQKLEDLGYDTMMLFVNTSLDVAQERNLQRPRSLDPKVVKKMWDAVQQNIMSFQQLFGAKDFYVIDNSGGLEDPSRQSNFSKVQKAVDRFINTPPRRPAARQWLAAQKPGGATPNRELPVESVNKRTDEALPLIGLAITGARMAAPWAIRQGARILAGAGRGAAATPGAVAQIGRGIGAAGTGVGLGYTGKAIYDIVQMAEEGIDEIAPLITSVLGNEAVQKVVRLSTKYGLPILAAVALLYGGKKVIDYLNKKGEGVHETTAAGGVAAVAIPIGTTQKRIPTKKKPKRKKA